MGLLHVVRENWGGCGCGYIPLSLTVAYFASVLDANEYVRWKNGATKIPLQQRKKDKGKRSQPR